MPVLTSAVGYRQSIVAEVTPRWALAYSASLDLRDEIYLDDARPGGVVVPPTFCVCLEWALVGSPKRAEHFQLNETERRRGVHFVQDSTFFKPIRTGTRVQTTSEIVYVRNTSAGAYVLTRLESSDEATGELLVKSWSGSLLRGVPAERPEIGVLPPDYQPPADSGPVTGDEDEVLIDRAQPHLYTECARIWNPIHTERRVALAAGLDDIIVHGTATWAIAAREIARHRAGGNLGRLRRLAGSFRALIIPGTRIRVVHAPDENGGGYRFNVLNAANVSALSSGFVEFDGAG